MLNNNYHLDIYIYIYKQINIFNDNSGVLLWKK